MGCVLGRGMNIGPVHHHNYGQVNIPVTLVLRDVLCQHVLNRTVHTLNHAITLWVVQRCSRFLDIAEVIHFLEQVGFEVPTLVSVDTLRCPEPGNNLVHQLFRDCL